MGAVLEEEVGSGWGQKCPRIIMFPEFQVDILYRSWDIHQIRMGKVRMGPCSKPNRFVKECTFTITKLISLLLKESLNCNSSINLEKDILIQKIRPMFKSAINYSVDAFHFSKLDSIVKHLNHFLKITKNAQMIINVNLSKVNQELSHSCLINNFRHQLGFEKLFIHSFDELTKRHEIWECVVNNLEWIDHSTSVHL